MGNISTRGSLLAAIVAFGALSASSAPAADKDPINRAPTLPGVTPGASSMRQTVLTAVENQVRQHYNELAALFPRATLAVLSAITFFFITRRVVHTTRLLPKRGGTEEMVGGEAEARSAIDPTGKAFMRGTLWSARLAEGVSPVGFGDRVTVEAVDGLTLVVRPVSTTTADRSQVQQQAHDDKIVGQPNQGAS